MRPIPATNGANVRTIGTKRAMMIVLRAILLVEGVGPIEMLLLDEAGPITHPVSQCAPMS